MTPFSHRNPSAERWKRNNIAAIRGLSFSNLVITGTVTAAFAMVTFAAILTIFASDLAGQASVIDGDTREFMGRASASGELIRPSPDAPDRHGDQCRPICAEIHGRAAKLIAAATSAPLMISRLPKRSTSLPDRRLPAVAATPQRNSIPARTRMSPLVT
jgi:hypothetical protein